MPNARNGADATGNGTPSLTVHVHESTGRRYSYNHETEETKWISENEEASLQDSYLVDEIVTDSYEETIAARQEQLRRKDISELQVLIVSWNVGNAKPMTTSFIHFYTRVKTFGQI